MNENAKKTIENENAKITTIVPVIGGVMG